MPAPADLPPYPPERDRWSFPPPPVRRGWLAVAALGSVLAVVLAVAAIATITEMESRDARAIIDSERVTPVVERECARMTAAVEHIVPQGPPRLQAQALEAQNIAIERMLTGIRELPERVRAADEPLNAWLADWQGLLSARQRWADAVAQGFSGDFSVPRDDSGAVVTRRMDDAAAELCAVPEAVVDPFGVTDLEV